MHKFVKPIDVNENLGKVLNLWITEEELSAKLKEAFPRDFESKILRKRTHVSSFKVSIENVTGTQKRKRDIKA